METGLPVISAPCSGEGALRDRVGAEASGAGSAPSGQRQPGGDGALCGAGMSLGSGAGSFEP